MRNPEITKNTRTPKFPWSILHSPGIGTVLKCQNRTKLIESALSTVSQSATNGLVARKSGAKLLCESLHVAPQVIFG